MERNQPRHLFIRNELKGMSLIQIREYVLMTPDLTQGELRLIWEIACPMRNAKSVDDDWTLHEISCRL